MQEAHNKQSESSSWTHLCPFNPLSIIANDMRPQPRFVTLGQFSRSLGMAVKPCHAPTVGAAEARPRPPGNEFCAASLTLRNSRRWGSVDFTSTKLNTTLRAARVDVVGKSVGSTPHYSIVAARCVLG